MTAERTVANIVLGESPTAVTVYSISVEKNLTKTLVNITPPQSTANSSLGPKDTKIVDLQRIEVRFTVSGYINSTDQTNLEALFNGGGTFNMTWNGTDYDINMDKLAIDEFKKEVQDEKGITFTCIVGVDI